jgi:hypothetical protein
MTARDMGWRSIKNGELLLLASRKFDVFVTVDRNLSFQQNLGALSHRFRQAGTDLDRPRSLGAGKRTTNLPRLVSGRYRRSATAFQ